MIQLSVNSLSSGFLVGTSNIVYMRYLNIETNGMPLMEIRSHQTGGSTTCIPNSYGEIDPRFSQVNIRTRIFEASESDRKNYGFVQVGIEERPMGFYDVIAYQNSSAGNLDPTGLTVLWRGLGNLTAQQTGTNKFPAVEYTEYDTNDTDTESVYITF